MNGSGSGISFGGGRVRGLIAFALPLVLITYYALRGGSYDSVVWQEEAIAIWWVLGLGYGLGILPRRRLPRGSLIVLGAAAALVAWTALGVLWTESDERTVEEVARVLHFAGVLLLVWSVLDSGTWRFAAGGLAAGACLVCALAVGSRLLPEAFPDDPIARAFPDLDRLSYPLNYWNALAAWGAMSMTMALAWSAHARLLFARIAALAATPVCGLTLYLTYSRAGAVSVAVAIVAVIVLSRNRWVAAAHALAAGGGTTLAIAVARGEPAIAKGGDGTGAEAVAIAIVVGALLCGAVVAATWALRGDRRWRLPRRAGRLAAALGVLVVLAVSIPLGASEASDLWVDFREGSPSALESVSLEDRFTTVGGARYEYWRVALDALEADPLHGAGPGSFEFLWNRAGIQGFVRDAHSLYLEQLAEAGITGAVLIIALLAALAAAALRPRIKALAGIGARISGLAVFAVFLVHAGVDWLWESTAVTVLALGAVAVAAIPAGKESRRPPRRVLMRVAVPVVAAVAILVELPGLVSTSEIRASQEAFRQGDLTTATAAASGAVDARPWAASPYVQRGLVLEFAGNLDAARLDMFEAIEREPTNWRHRLLLARIEASRGEPQAAIAAYREARKLRPASQFLQAP